MEERQDLWALGGAEGSQLSVHRYRKLPASKGFFDWYPPRTMSDMPRIDICDSFSDCHILDIYRYRAINLLLIDIGVIGLHIGVICSVLHGFDAHKSKRPTLHNSVNLTLSCRYGGATSESHGREPHVIAL